MFFARDAHWRHRLVRCRYLQPGIRPHAVAPPDDIGLFNCFLRLASLDGHSKSCACEFGTSLNIGTTALWVEWTLVVDFFSSSTAEVEAN